MDGPANQRRPLMGFAVPKMDTPNLSDFSETVDSEGEGLIPCMHPRALKSAILDID